MGPLRPVVVETVITVIGVLVEMGISWTMMLISCGGVVAGTAALWYKFRYSDNTSVLPRLVLIQALQENMERLQLEMVSDTWDDFASGLSKNLDAVKQELAPIDASKGDGLKIFMKVFDAKLVNFLREFFAEPGAASILEGYLPRAGQTWNSFLKGMTEEEQHFFDVEISRHFPLTELKEYLLGSIEELLEQSIDAQASIDLDRKTDDEEKLEPTPRSYKIVKILYTTDRKVTTDGEYIGVISTRSSSSSSPLQYGWVEVGIPTDHEVGSREAPAGTKEEADPSNHVVILSVNTKPRGDFKRFVECMENDLATIGNEDNREILVYIHGYNARHLNSIKQAAQLKDDLNFKGTVILYSWSSKGTLKAYFDDELNVQKTALSLEAFLKDIMHKVKARRVHIIAHSMGNRALVGALLNLYRGQRAGPLATYPFSQIILVAADEQRSRFEELVGILNKRYKSPSSIDLPGTSESIGRIKSGALGTRPVPHLSVYCSTGDLPLAFSRVVHGRRRLGDTRSLLESTAASLGDHDVIDTSGVKGGSYKHHSYHVESPSVIADIKNLLAQRVPASRRSNLEYIENFEGRCFYAFNRECWSGKTTC